MVLPKSWQLRGVQPTPLLLSWRGGLSPAMPASQQVHPWGLELFLFPMGAGTAGDCFFVAASTALIENLLFPSGLSQLGSALNELFIKTLDTD